MASSQNLKCLSAKSNIVQPKRGKKHFSSKYNVYNSLLDIISKWFYSFLLFSAPHEPALRAKWIENISKHQEFNNIVISYPVCCLHFDESEILRRGKRTTLVKGAVPTIFPK